MVSIARSQPNNSSELQRALWLSLSPSPLHHRFISLCFALAMQPAI